MKPKLYSSVAMLSGVTLLYCTAETVLAGSVQSTTADQTRSTLLTIRYGQGVMDAQINQAPLSEVLHELSKRTGVGCHPLDPVIAHKPITVTIQGAPLDQGIQRILAGFSYVMYRAEVKQPPQVIVLSTPPAPTAMMGSEPGSAIAPLAQSAVDAPIPPTDLQADEDYRSAERLALEEAQQETTLMQALDGLHSSDDGKRIEAVEQLVGREDPRATQALIEVASDTNGSKNSTFRAHAVHALWRHAADLLFEDSSSIAAIEQLSGNADSSVRDIARQALADMQRFLKEQA